MAHGRIGVRAMSTLGWIPNAVSLSHFSMSTCICRKSSFHTTAAYYTDGVYQELTAMRVKTPFIEALKRQKDPEINPRKKSDPIAAQPRRNLPRKRMSDSYHRVVLPLARDPWLLDNYLNANGHIRLGTLFMDLDALSGVIAYKHTGESVTTVTAAVDRITIKHPLKELCDLELSGQVTFTTGRSSMEISLEVARAAEDGAKVRPEDVLLDCAFTMVSLDPETKRPVAVAPLLVESSEDRRLFSLGENNYKAKKEFAKIALRKQTPNDQESDLIHAMWLKQLDYHDPNISVRKPDNVFYMDNTRIHSSQIMQPQYRNRHNFMIFGGFLLKQTFELAFCCAASFSHSRPTFLSLDPSTFDNPVPVGSVLYLTATVAYTDPPLVDINNESKVTDGPKTSKYTKLQIRVDSKVRNIEHGDTKPTGQFNYTFLVEKDVKVMPRTYSEFMIWIDARRRVERVAKVMDESDLIIQSGHRGDSGKVGVTE